MKPIKQIYAEGRFLSLVYDKNGVTTPVSISEKDPNFNSAVKAFQDNNWELLANIVFPEKIINDYIVDGDLEIREGFIYYNGTPVRHIIAEKILLFKEKGLPFLPLMRFFSKLLKNPNPNSIEQFYDFLERHNLPICNDGDFIAYKGVQRDNYSVHYGGEQLKKGNRNERGQILNSVGNWISMKRNDVNANQTVGCSAGLHVGSWSYASSFAPKVLAIKVNPMDVVSVPSDCNFQKVRTCRYKVLEEVSTPIENEMAKIKDNVVSSYTIKA